MPTPKPGETRDDYMSRCIPMVMDEGHDKDQAMMMCKATFDKQMGSGKRPKLLALSAPVEITAGATEGEKKGPAKFTATFYTGGALSVEGWDLPVVVDLAGLKNSKVLVANLDHDRTKRIGNFAVANDGKSLVANGTASARTAARDEVIGSAEDGYQWQASLEVNPDKVEEVKAGKTIQANGQKFEGPLYVTRTGTLKGFAFVSHGADDDTTATIAATAASTKGTKMDAALKTWIEEMLPGTDVDELSAEALANLEANYKGQNGKKPKIDASNPFAARKEEAKRRKDIRAYGDKFIEDRDSDEEEIEGVETMVDHAIETKMDFRDFRAGLHETIMYSPAKPRGGVRTEPKFGEDVIEAAICESLRLPDLEKHFKEQTLDASHKLFKNGIGLKQLLILAAEGNGYKANYSGDVSKAVLKAAFLDRSERPRQIQAQGWSYVEISTIISNVAGKFLREGFMAVEDTWSRIATIRNVRDFKSITTVSLVGDLMFEKIGAAGEIPHGTLGEVTYSNKADTYARMLAITRQDIINDDLGALSAAPRRLGRGAATKLNDIFWTEWLGGESAGFWAATHTAAGNTGNSNLNSGAADMTLAGLTASELLFLNQVDPQGLPMGVMPRIVLVPNALKAAAAALLNAQSQLVAATSTAISNVNVFAGRFRLESSSYLANANYSGYSAIEWYMLADPNEIPSIEIAALNGRVEPTVESADADFNTLGIQIRAYGDVGVNLQEFRGSVLNDGGSS